MTGITIANGATCGVEEHLHEEECLAEPVLICGYTEESSESETPPDTEITEGELSSGETPAAHVHTDECYRVEYQCGYEEHLHVISCYADATADLETAADWEATLPELTGDWTEDLVLVAQSQIGVGESERNYILAEDGETHNGITRYGQWYGNPHGDWSAMFAAFCMKYAQIPDESIPWSPGVYNMMRLAEDAQLLSQPDDRIGMKGNFLFLDTDGNGNADRVVIVSGEDTGVLTAIGGDLENSVQEIRLSGTDASIVGYIGLQQAQERYLLSQYPEDPPADGAEDENAPLITLDVTFPEEGILRLTAQVENMDPSRYDWQWQISQNGEDPWFDIEGATGLACDVADTDENLQWYYRVQGRKRPMMFAVKPAAEVPAGTVVSDNGNTVTSGAVTPFSIGKNGNTYVIDVYAIPVDFNGNRIASMEVTDLGSFNVNSTSKTNVQTKFSTSLGTYQSAYFGSETSVNVDNIATVWRYRSGNTYYLAYAQTNGTQNQRWKSRADNAVSLYLRYIPQFTVVFESDGFEPVSEKVSYGQCPTLTVPGTWEREGYTLIGWTIGDSGQTVYTYEELVKLPITQNMTYRAKWKQFVTVSFDLGEQINALYPVQPMTVQYGAEVPVLPTPAWRDNHVSMAFDGWYLNPELTQPVPSPATFYEDTILYAKWTAPEEGYYVYFMDFNRAGQEPLVLATYSVTENNTASPYVAANPPDGMAWDGVWYLDEDRTVPYDFRIPVSEITDYLQGASGRDLLLYPGTQAVCRAIFITYGSRIDPVIVAIGGTVDLDRYIPERDGYNFAGWTTADGTPVSGRQVLTETTTFYAEWTADYVPFDAILRIENADDTAMTQADILGRWYAKAGSQIKVKSTYSGTGSSRTGSHQVFCVMDGVEYPVYTDAALTRQATLSDAYATYFVFNNVGTQWSDEVNWDDIYTGGQLPYSTRPVSSTGDTIINFDYMRVRLDITFTIPNGTGGAYIDVYKLYRAGIITGSVSYDGSTPTSAGSNVSAHGVSSGNVSWTYTAGSGTTGNNYYTLHHMKYGQHIYDVYPVGSIWLTARRNAFHWYESGSGDLFSSRRDSLVADFFNGSGRKLAANSLTAVFAAQDKIALMYAIECLKGETADFTIGGVGYKVHTELCEVVNHTGSFSQKELFGFVKGGNNSYSNLSTTNSTIGGTSVRTLFGSTYWHVYDTYEGVDSLSSIDTAYIFYYTRQGINIQFGFAYDADGDDIAETVSYEDIAYGERITEYRYGSPNQEQNRLLDRDGYVFVGWLDADGNILTDADWNAMTAHGDGEDSAMIFFAKWEKLSDNIVEYYEDVSAAAPFETHYFENGSLLEYPTMAVYPDGWVWQEYGEGTFRKFDWDVPMYGEYGVKEYRELTGEKILVNVLRVYGAWDETHTKVVYDPNAAQGGVPGTAPTDANEYTIWQSDVSVRGQGTTANADPDMVFAGWLLNRDGTVYQPGDHVPVRWPRTMIFTAQWAKKEAVVHLRYAPNGGRPDTDYPIEDGFAYRKNATASVWDNTGSDGSAWFVRHGYTFTGWNTKPDGSGIAYALDSSIVLEEPMTTLYAQWKRDFHTMSLYKVDSEFNTPLTGAEFGLYRLENGLYIRIDTVTTGVDGHITVPGLETDVRYKLVEEKPPDGYAIMTKEIYFALLSGENSVILRFYDANGNVITHPNGVTGEYVTGSKYLTLHVTNLRGYALPSTGGMGFPLYILCGLLLTAAPLVLGLSLRRKSERRSSV